MSSKGAYKLGLEFRENLSSLLGTRLDLNRASQPKKIPLNFYIFV